ncbi:IclR family transcriptional regulator [Lacisediminihabitans profunda]|uniref:IclR family transcriptional regulator n=1 Tax=Lacisediminihabitans profunda TaxID=2594790 RepID=A0A5C8UR81_9MICO|nr:IclR family transcriptional regulator [Lacisediminihabitans profunda]TXN29967.1 IclR family transcriptional regulator [Lacisediminihabitans profunda]
MAVQGAQVVSRVALVLRLVSESAPRGITTAALARQAVLTRPTVHRLLVSLAAEGFVDRDELLGTWVLGPELYLMGSVAAARYDITTVAAPRVQALARETGESAFLSARRGDETVCLLREDGSFPLRSFVLFEGVRFPLGVASAGIAILAYLPENEITEYLDRRHLEVERGAAHSSTVVRERLALTRRTGWALNPGLVLEGSWGMGAAIFDGRGLPAWALSITGVEFRFATERRAELGRLLLEHAHAITQALRGEKTQRNRLI